MYTIKKTHGSVEEVRAELYDVKDQGMIVENPPILFLNIQFPKPTVRGLREHLFRIEDQTSKLIFDDQSLMDWFKAMPREVR